MKEKSRYLKEKRTYNISMMLFTKSGVDMFPLILENAKVLYKSKANFLMLFSTSSHGLNKKYMFYTKQANYTPTLNLVPTLSIKREPMEYFVGNFSYY